MLYHKGDRDKVIAMQEKTTRLNKRIKKASINKLSGQRKEKDHMDENERSCCGGNAKTK